MAAYGSFVKKSFHKLKSPTASPDGASTAPFLAKSTILWAWEGSLAYGAAPITVAGPRPIRTAFPASHACKFELRVYVAPRTESIHAEKCRAGQRFFQLGLRFS